MTIKDTDKGYKDLARRVFGMKAAQIKVGILEQEGAESHGDGTTVLDVAGWNEFGTEDIPARSFVRAYVDENEGKIRAEASKLMESVLKGKREPEQILEILGQRMVGGMQKRISDRIDPANKPSTVAKKGSDVPLIDKGQLRSSITYKVTL